MILWLCNLGYKDAAPSDFFFFLITPVLPRTFSLPLTPSFRPQAISTMTTPIRTLPGTTIQFRLSRLMFTTSHRLLGSSRCMCHDIFLQRPFHPYLSWVHRLRRDFPKTPSPASKPPCGMVRKASKAVITIGVDPCYMI